MQETFDDASQVLGYDLWSLCQQGPEADLAATERTQPAMLAAGVATWRVWCRHGGPRPVAMAGHSLGEYTALVLGVQEVSPLKVRKIPNPSGTGGRVNGLAVHPTAPLVMYAASEWGGLYKTIDGGRNWSHLVNHTPLVTWDVEVHPSDPQRVIATSFYDGRVPARSGINLSTDGGNTWSRPPSAEPPGACANPADQTELTAFGISISPSAPSRVYVGTSCGLATSNDSGTSWTYRTPPQPNGSRIWVK